MQVRLHAIALFHMRRITSSHRKTLSDCLQNLFFAHISQSKLFEIDLFIFHRVAKVIYIRVNLCWNRCSNIRLHIGNQTKHIVLMFAYIITMHIFPL